MNKFLDTLKRHLSVESNIDGTFKKDQLFIEIASAKSSDLVTNTQRVRVKVTVGVVVEIPSEAGTGAGIDPEHLELEARKQAYHMIRGYFYNGIKELFWGMMDRIPLNTLKQEDMQWVMDAQETMSVTLGESDGRNKRG